MSIVWGWHCIALMAEDGFGKGRVVFYAAISREDAEHL